VVVPYWTVVFEGLSVVQVMVAVVAVTALVTTELMIGSPPPVVAKV
jgi:hypothetical protein